MQGAQSPHVTTAIVTPSELTEQVDRKLRIYRTELPADLNERARVDLPPRPLPFLCGWGPSLSAEGVRPPHPYAEQDRHDRVRTIECPKD